MKISKFPNTLTFRILLPGVILFLFLGLGLYLFVLRSISEFERNIIQEDMEWISSSIFNILDRGYYQLLVSGSARDEIAGRISRGEALGGIENLMRQHQFLALVYSDSGQVVFSPEDLREEIDGIMTGVESEQELRNLQLGGKIHYLYRFRFEPWEWHVVIVKGASGYANLLSRVRIAYGATAFILIMAAALLYLVLNAHLKRPVQQIMDPITRGEPPDYRGISEFEFLSKSITEMMSSLRDNAKWIDTLISTVGALIVVTDHEGRVSMFNRTAESMTGFRTSEVKGQYLWDFLIPQLYLSRVREAYDRLRSHGGIQTLEAPIITKDGKELAVLWNNTVIMDDNGVPQWFISTGLDITDRLYAEEKLVASLKEKEVLLQEIHHRVKNNLQVISGLLDLQAHHITDAKGREIYKESQNRVLSMALIHEELYRAKNLAKVDFPAYIQSLVGNLIVSYGVSDEKVKFTVETEEIDLNVDSAIPCGLIVNELVSNAFKHAFPDGKKGEVRVSFRKLEDKFYELTVTDDGVGLPEGMDSRQSDTLGMQLVYILSDLLGAKLELERERGTSFRIRFEEYMEAGTEMH